MRDPPALRSRVAAAPRSRALASTRFVEVSGADVVRRAAGASIEVADAQGARLTVRLAEGAECDVAQLVEAFRRASR